MLSLLMMTGLITATPLPSFDLRISLAKDGQTSLDVLRLASTSEGCFSWFNGKSNIEREAVCQRGLRNFETSMQDSGKIQTGPAHFVVRLRTQAGLQIAKTSTLQKSILSRQILELLSELRVPLPKY